MLKFQSGTFAALNTFREKHSFFDCDVLKATEPIGSGRSLKVIDGEGAQEFIL